MKILFVALCTAAGFVGASSMGIDKGSFMFAFGMITGAIITSIYDLKVKK